MERRIVNVTKEVRQVAVIREFKAGSQEVRPHPTEVDCYYQVLAGPDGAKRLHLSTFWFGRTGVVAQEQPVPAARPGSGPRSA